MAGQGLSWLGLSPEPPGHERLGGWKEERQMLGQEEIHHLNRCQLKISDDLLRENEKRLHFVFVLVRVGSETLNLRFQETFNDDPLPCRACGYGAST